MNSEKQERKQRLEEQLSNIQLVSPWSLETNQNSDILSVLNPDVDQFKWDLKREVIQLPPSLRELKFSIYSATSDIKSGNLPLKRTSNAVADVILCFSQVDK